MTVSHFFRRALLLTANWGTRSSWCRPGSLYGSSIQKTTQCQMFLKNLRALPSGWALCWLTWCGLSTCIPYHFFYLTVSCFTWHDD